MTSTTPQQASWTVLFVEDQIKKNDVFPDKYSVDNTYQELCDQGWDVDVAENGAQAFSKLKENRYDIILFDIDMPVGESPPNELLNTKGRQVGLKLIELLTHENSTFQKSNDAVILVLTALIDEDTWSKLDSWLGQENCLEKPTLPTDVVETIKKAKAIRNGKAE